MKKEYKNISSFFQAYATEKFSTTKAIIHILIKKNERIPRRVV